LEPRTRGRGAVKRVSGEVTKRKEQTWVFALHMRDGIKVALKELEVKIRT
jgi:hypothetical protein